jgi:hypothetical protein
MATPERSDVIVIHCECDTGISCSNDTELLCRAVNPRYMKVWVPGINGRSGSLQGAFKTGASRKQGKGGRNEVINGWITNLQRQPSKCPFKAAHRGSSSMICSSAETAGTFFPSQRARCHGYKTPQADCSHSAQITPASAGEDLCLSSGCHGCTLGTNRSCAACQRATAMQTVRVLQTHSPMSTLHPDRRVSCRPRTLRLTCRASAQATK